MGSHTCPLEQPENNDRDHPTRWWLGVHRRWAHSQHLRPGSSLGLPSRGSLSKPLGLSLMGSPHRTAAVPVIQHARQRCHQLTPGLSAKGKVEVGSRCCDLSWWSVVGAGRNQGAKVKHRQKARIPWATLAGPSLDGMKGRASVSSQETRVAHAIVCVQVCASAYMCIHVSVYTCMCACVHASLCALCVLVCIGMYVSVHACLYMYLHMCKSITNACVCAHVHMSLCAYLCVHMCTCVHECVCLCN